MELNFNFYLTEQELCVQLETSLIKLGRLLFIWINWIWNQNSKEADTIRIVQH